MENSRRVDNPLCAPAVTQTVLGKSGFTPSILYRIADLASSVRGISFDNSFIIMYIKTLIYIK